MSTATDGRRREHKVRDDLIGHGWVFIARAAASKGPADLIMAHPLHGVALVQVGSKSKTLGPADRERLCTAADLCSALALLAVVVPRQPIAYYEVTRETPSKWPRLNPATCDPYGGPTKHTPCRNCGCQRKTHPIETCREWVA